MEAFLAHESGLLPYEVREVGVRRLGNDCMGWVKSQRRFDERLIPLPSDRQAAEFLLAERLVREHGFEAGKAVELSRPTVRIDLHRTADRPSLLELLRIAPVDATVAARKLQALPVGCLGAKVFALTVYSDWEVRADLPADRRCLLGFCIEGPQVDRRELLSREDAIAQARLLATSRVYQVLEREFRPLTELNR